MVNTCQAIKGFNNFAYMMCVSWVISERVYVMFNTWAAAVFYHWLTMQFKHIELSWRTLSFYLQEPSENPFFLSSHMNSEFLYSCKQPAPDMETFSLSQGCLLTTASFQCSDKTCAVSVLNSFKKIPGVFPSMHFSLCWIKNVT